MEYISPCWKPWLDKQSCLTLLLPTMLSYMSCVRNAIAYIMVSLSYWLVARLFGLPSDRHCRIAPDGIYGPHPNNLHSRKLDA